MPACGANPKRLYDCTNKQIEASLAAKTRDQLKQSRSLWYADMDPSTYHPYLVRVTAIDNKTMHFVFLDCFTGDDLVLSVPSYEIAYRDPQHAWAAWPSNVHMIEPAELQAAAPRSCGLLFISGDYMTDEQNVSKGDYAKIAQFGGGDGKWPIAAGGMPGRVIPNVITELRDAIATTPASYQESLESALQRLESHLGLK